MLETLGGAITDLHSAGVRVHIEGSSIFALPKELRVPLRRLRCSIIPHNFAHPFELYGLGRNILLPGIGSNDGLLLAASTI